MLSMLLESITIKYRFKLLLEIITAPSSIPPVQANGAHKLSYAKSENSKNMLCCKLNLFSAKFYKENCLYISTSFKHFPSPHYNFTRGKVRLKC